MQKSLFVDVPLSTRKKSTYLQNITNSLGDLSQWEYRGECQDLQFPSGSCSCGHGGLRFLFTIHHKQTKETKIVGSVCINLFQETNPDMVLAIEAARDRMELAAKYQAKPVKPSAQTAFLPAIVAALAK